MKMMFCLSVTRTLVDTFIAVEIILELCMIICEY